MKTEIHVFIKSHSLIPRMRSVSDESCTENHNTHFLFSSFFFSFSKMVPFTR